MGFVVKDLRERGASAVEYGLLIAFIAAVILGTVLVLGVRVESLFALMDGAFG